VLPASVSISARAFGCPRQTSTPEAVHNTSSSMRMPPRPAPAVHRQEALGAIEAHLPLEARAQRRRMEDRGTK